MNGLSERIATLEARHSRHTEEEWRRLCAAQGWTPEFLRGVLQDALDAVGPDHPDAAVFRAALAQQEASHAPT